MKCLGFFSIFVLTLCIFAAPSFAAEPQHPAGKIIKNAIDNVIGKLESPVIKTPGPERDRLLKDIEDIIYAQIDFEEFSARTIGAKWHEFTPKQRADFQGAMTDLLYYTYFKSLLQYSGEPFEYAGEIVSSKGDKVEVKTNFIYEGKPVPINFRMQSKDGKWLAYDLFVENVSFVQNYRGQFQQILQKNSTDELIKMIRDKADETKVSTDAALGA